MVSVVPVEHIGSFRLLHYIVYPSVILSDQIPPKWPSLNLTAKAPKNSWFPFGISEIPGVSHFQVKHVSFGRGYARNFSFLTNKSSEVNDTVLFGIRFGTLTRLTQTFWYARLMSAGWHKLGNSPLTSKCRAYVTCFCWLERLFGRFWTALQWQTRYIQFALRFALWDNCIYRSWYRRILQTNRSSLDSKLVSH